MTRRDYERIAAAIGSAISRVAGLPFTREERRLLTLGYGILTDSLCDALEADNPRFDRERFINAATEIIEEDGG